MNILITGSNRYPRGDAGALREETFAKMLISMGHNVKISGLGECTDFKWKKFNGIIYISLRSSKDDLINRALNRLLYFPRLMRCVLSTNHYDIVLITGGLNHTFKRLKRYSCKNDIKLIFDCVEWYSPNQFRAGVFAKAYIDKNILNSKIIDNHFNVIAISTYLNEYFTCKGIKTARIPVVLDIADYPFIKRTHEDKVVFIYAGTPGRKDYLSDIINSFILLDAEEKKKCELRLVGVSKKQLIDCCGVTKKEIEGLDGLMQCLGRVSHQEVKKLYEEADFSLFLRNAELRYAKAGFPTKFVESLAFGTPVICNISSDLGMYAKDGINTIACSECTPEAMKTCIQKVLRMSSDERKLMQVNARNSFEKEFDYKIYIPIMEELLS